MKEYYDRRAPEYDATPYELVRASDDAADLDRLEASSPTFHPAGSSTLPAARAG
jgi:hypothetical protein